MADTFTVERSTTWTMTGPMTLMGRIFGLFMSTVKLVGGDSERRLARLEGVAEQV